MVEDLACGTCSDCCASKDTPSCEDADVAACVCAFDGFCCDSSWDSLCVSEVEDLGCGVCL